VPNGPLALNPYQLWPHVEDQVISLVSERSRYADPKFDRGVCDRGLGDGALLVGRKHDRILVF
jgi:hypothetical protein